MQRVQVSTRTGATSSSRGLSTSSRTSECRSIRRPAPLGGRKFAPLAPIGKTRCPAVADVPAALTPKEAPQTDEDRAALAYKLGYEQIGKELPDNVTLGQIIKTMPQEVFEKDHGKAWTACLISVVAFAASIYLISVVPWYLLPVAWFISGTAFTGWFVVGHDCGHRSFHKNKLVEDIVGTIAFMPLIYPFEPWRIKHNHHHAHTNKLVEDTAWHPVMKEMMDEWGPVEKITFKTFLGSPLKFFASVGHWLIWHFDTKLYTEKQRPRVLVSLAACALFAGVAFPLIVANAGWFGLVKYWLMPWLGYHWWMSCFTVVHHTAPHISFQPEERWNAAKAQLSGTVHCVFPRWIEFLTHDINVHVPHHVASGIPWYNLRKAHASLIENWGEYMTTTTFNWRLFKHICTECHLYDEDHAYVPFDYKKEETFFALQRKLIPESY